MVNRESKQICDQRFEEFKKQNELFLNNPLIKNFLKNKQYFKLFLNTLCNSTEENKKMLDNAFKLYYFNIRFTSFISSSLYFNAINYDKKQRKYYSRFPLTLDSPAMNDEDMTFKETVEDPISETSVEKVLNSKDIADYIEDPVLYAAIQTLSEKQRQVISLAYINCLTDTEIALLLNKTQQSVSKIHKRTLEKIQEFLKRNGGYPNECNRLT